MQIKDDKCLACGQCLEYCEQGAIKIREEREGYGNCYIDQDICIDCKACLDFECPGNAIKPT